MEPDFLTSIVRPDPTKPETLVQQIYHGIHNAVLTGRLPATTELPSTRHAANQLGVGRNAVLAAYDLLAAEGVIETAARKRPRVVAHFSPPEQNRSACIAMSRRALAAPHTAPEGTSLLAPGSPDPKLFPADLWARALRRAARHRQDGAECYANFSGLPELRHILAMHLYRHRGIHATPDDILVTSGTQSSLMLCANAFADPDDVALVENPGYRHAYSCFSAMGLRCRALRVDEHGAMACPTAFEGAKLAYLTPSTQYPTGIRTPIARKLALLEQAHRNQTLLIEDDYDSEFVWDGRGIPALGALDGGQRVLTIGTAAKTLLPGLRIGWIVAPKGTADHLRQMQRRLGIGANVHAQAAFADVLSSGQYRSHIKTISTEYHQRMCILHEILHQHLGQRIELSNPDGGLQIMIQIKGLKNDVPICKYLNEAGYGVAPLSDYYLENSDFGILAGFGNATARQCRDFAVALSNGLACTMHE